MKLAKLSLAAITVVSLSASAFAADSFAEMFKEGAVSGNLAAYYWNLKKPTKAGKTPEKSGSIINFGLDLSYKTGSYDGISAGATFQSTHSPFTDAQSNGATVFKGDMWGSGEVLSEAYVMYKNSDAYVKVGRQYISTAIVAGSGSRTTKQSFEGYTAGYNGLANTTFMVGYISAFQSRTDNHGGIAKFSHVGTSNYNGTSFDTPVNAEKGAYTFYVTNKSVKGLKLQAQYLSAPDLISIYYMQADYTGKTDSFSYGVSGQYNMTDYDKSSVKDSGFYGLKASIGMNAFNVTAAYNKTEDDNGARQGLGGGANKMFASLNLIGNAADAGETLYGLKVDYSINKDMSAFAYYVNSDVSEAANETASNKYNAYAVGGSYNFDGALKGLGLSTVYEMHAAGTDGGKDGNEFRFNAIYAF